MALVKSKKAEKAQIKISIEKSTLDRCLKYSSWAGVELDELFEQASEFLLKKDKEWQKYFIDKIDA